MAFYRRVFNGVYETAPGSFVNGSSDGSEPRPLRKQIIDAGPDLLFEGPEVFLGNQVARCLTPKAPARRISAERAPQIVAGALVAEASMRALGIDTVDICPWALREGLILRKLDSEADGTALVETPVGDAGSRADRQQAARNGGKASDRSRGNRR